MAKEPKIGAYLDDEKKQMIETLEADDAVFVSHLTPKRKKEIEAMSEGKPYQTLVGSILHKAVS
jgi:predicted DNA binding CopG/RHH family protein